MPDVEKEDRRELQRAQEVQQQTPAHQEQQKVPEGPGTKAAQGLLGKGNQDPKAYARVVGQYPTEKQAILGTIQKSALGNDFAGKVAEEVDGWSLDKKGKRLMWTDDDSDSYFVAGQKRKGAEFKFGDTKGTADKDGLNTETQLDDGSKLVGRAGPDKKDKKNITASLDKVEEGQSYGVGANYHTKDKSAGLNVHGEKDLGDGAKGDAKVGGEYKDGKLAALGEVGYSDEDTKARLKSRFAGGDDYSLGFTGSEKLDSGATLGGGLSWGEKAGVGTLAGDLGYTQKDWSASGKGSFSDGDNFSLLGRGSRKADDGTWSGGLGYAEKGGVGTTSGDLGFKANDWSAKGSGAFTDQDNYNLRFDGSRKLGEGQSLSGYGSHTVKDGVDTQAFGLNYADGKDKYGLKGAYTDRDNYSLGATGHQSLLGGPLTLDQSLSHTRKDGNSVTDGRFTAGYNTKDHIFSGSAGAQYDHGADAFSYDAKAEGITTLKSGLLYGQGFGAVKGGTGMDGPDYHIGGGLTITPHEKMALSMLGVMDQSGGFDVRMQYDLFKKKINSAKDLNDNRKKAMLSVFAGYKQGMDDHDFMGDRYGAGKFGHNEGQAYVGIGFKF